MSRDDFAVVVLGGGLAGLAVGMELGDDAVVLEREARPGGLARTECFDGFWFDHVLHLLHLSDPVTERRIQALVGEQLAPCPPDAWVETHAGTARYPLQMHLHGLDPAVVATCLTDLAAATYGPQGPAHNFEELLLNTFGRGLCELFLYPYNRKVWKRPLSELAPAGFQWTIPHPEFNEVLRGALSADHRFAPYNANSWYPRPPLDSPVRGMEVLTQALARRVPQLRLGHAVREIDLDARRVHVQTALGPRSFGYRLGCAASLPLPQLIGACRQAPARLKEACARLPMNRVLSVAVSIAGPRPRGRGLWRYYADEAICFSRVVYLHEFDPHLAPAHGWGLLVEITQPGEEPLPDQAELLARVRADLQRTGALPGNCRILDQRLLVNSSGYVVFTPESRHVVAEAQTFLRAAGLEPLGRYGRWEYSSMAQVIRDGFSWAAGLDVQAPLRRQGAACA